MVTTSKALIRDGARSCCRRRTCHRTTSWNAYTKCGYVSLIRPKPCWHCTIKTMSRKNVTKLPEIENPGKDKSRSEGEDSHQKPKNREKSTGKKQKRREIQSALKGNREIATSGTLKQSAQKETPAVSATMKVNVEKLHALPLSLQRRRRTTLGKVLRKASRPQEAVHLERGVRSRARTTSKEIAQLHHVIPGILPCA